MYITTCALNPRIQIKHIWLYTPDSKVLQDVYSIYTYKDMSVQEGDITQ